MNHPSLHRPTHRAARSQRRPQPLFRTALISVVLVAVPCAALAQPAGADESLYFQATMADAKMQALSGLTYAFAPDSSLSIVFAGAKANVKLADVKAVTFEWQTKKATVRLQNDKEFTVTLESVDLKSRGMIFKGVPLNVPFDEKQIKSLVRVEAPTTAPKVALPPSQGLFVVCSDVAAGETAVPDASASAPLLIGYTDNRGNYSPVQYAFTGVGAGTAVLSLPVSVREGRKMLLPVYYIESVAVDKEGKAQIKLVNGQVVAETIPDLADGAPGKRFYGVYEGRSFARTASTQWRQAKFSWGPVPEALPSPKAGAAGFEGRWYELSGVGVEPAVFVTGFLDKDGKAAQWGAVVSTKNGLEVDIVSGLGEGASMVLKPQQKQIEITAGDQTLQAAPENVPVALVGYVWTVSKVPIRVVARLEGVATMKPVPPPAGAVDAKQAEAALADAAEKARPVVWVVEDKGGNKWTVRDLGGNQLGEDFDEPPEGFVYSGGQYYVEDALLGGDLVAVGQGDLTLHLPCSLVAKTDAAAGTVTLTEAILGKTELPLRGFAGTKSIGDDVDNFLLAGQSKRKTLVLSAWLPDGGLYLIPADHVATFARLPAGETPPAFQEEPKVLGYDGTLKIRTADGEVEFTGSKIRYTLTGSPEDGLTAARWLAADKDEADDDPDRITVERVIVETKDGPTLPIELSRIESIAKAGDAFTVKLSDHTVSGSLAPCEIVGEGPFGEMTVDIAKILEVTVVRKGPPAGPAAPASPSSQ